MKQNDIFSQNKKGLNTRNLHRGIRINLIPIKFMDLRSDPIKIAHIVLWTLLIFLLTPIYTFAQTSRFSGKVVDSTAVGIPQVSVLALRANTKALTDANGLYEITSPYSTDTLVFTYVGYRTIKRTLNAGTHATITMVPSSELLDEIVVVGFGTQKKTNLTGAVTQIDGKALTNRPVANVGLALQGTIGNLNISPNGGPGGTVNYNVRGATSLSSGGSPFFIVDGIPVSDITNLNPTDIKSITVLKDAASAAIYGARAAYGVILVTTKSGEGKTKISYNNIIGTSKAIQTPHQLNSLEFAEAYNIASINSGQSPYFSEEHIARIKAFMADPVNTPSNVVDPNNTAVWSYAALDNDNVDWYRAFFKPSAPNQKHDVTISGGDEKTNYYVGAGYFREGGLIRYADENHERYNITGNLHFTPTKWLRADLKTRFVRDHLKLPSEAQTKVVGNWFHQATTRFPNWSLKDPNGYWSRASNIPRQWEGSSRTTNNEINIMGALEAEPIKNWKINTEISYRNNGIRWSDQMKPFAWEHTVSGLPVMTTDNSYSEAMTQSDYYVMNFYTSYEKYFSKHYLSALIGQQAELSKYSQLSGRRLDLIDTSLPSMGVATGDQTVNGSLSHWANSGTFMRLNYNYDGRYLLELNGRYDGSSKFAKDKRFGFFPSVSVGYNIANEPFWKIPAVNQLKLRASYGSLGNQNIDNYLYLNTIGIVTKYGYILDGVLPNYLAAPGLVSENLTWETARTLDFGVDLTTLRNRLDLSFDWYRRSTINMFGPANAYPAVLGASVPKENNADLRTLGFELSLSWHDKISDDFSYNINAILSDNKAEVTRYNNPTHILSTYYEGQTLGEIWGYKTAGLIQSEEQLAGIPDQSFIHGNWTLGDVEYVDINGDRKVDNGKNTVDDSGDLAIIGNSEPRYLYSLGLGASWKGFDINMFFQGVGKRDFAPPVSGNGGVLFWGFTGGFGANLYEGQTDFWTPDNADAYYAKPYTSSETDKNHQVQTRYLQNAAYLRLKNLQLGYTLPDKLINTIGLGRARIFVSGENLFTITSMKRNFDPEQTYGTWGAGKVYPYYKSYAIGLNIDF
uniref:TonB-dependent receptor n=1 Tax=Sphingobacterium sp. (strain 21) TaxID=743722 RepID=F4CEK2_SPHS2